MNINSVREEISNNIGKKVKIKVFGMRNKNNEYIGNISCAYPYIFTVLVSTENKSFSYADVITKEVVIEYL